MLCGGLIVRATALDQVTLSNANVYRNGVTGTVYAGVQINTSGIEYINDGGATQNFNTYRGKWLNSGASSAVWIERTVNSGTLDWKDPGTGRLQMSSTREYGVSRSTDGSNVANITLTAYDASSGGNQLDTVTFQIEAERGFL